MQSLTKPGSKFRPGSVCFCLFLVQHITESTHRRFTSITTTQKIRNSNFELYDFLIILLHGFFKIQHRYILNS